MSGDYRGLMLPPSAASLVDEPIVIVEHDRPVEYEAAGVPYVRLFAVCSDGQKWDITCPVSHLLRPETP